MNLEQLISAARNSLNSEFTYRSRSDTQSGYQSSRDPANITTREAMITALANLHNELIRTQDITKAGEINTVSDYINKIDYYMPRSSAEELRKYAVTLFNQAYPLTSGGRRMRYRSRKMKKHKKSKSHKKIKRGNRTKRRRY